MDLDQWMQLTEEEELRDIMMIGGIGVFLPFSQEEAEICVADGAAAEQSAEIVQEEGLEHTLEVAQEGKESEHYEEWLNDFSQEAEEAVTLKLIAEGADEEDDDNFEEWLNIFSQEAKKTATREVAEIEEEGADNIFFTDLWELIEALEERVKVQGVHIQ
jgi:hypothetical protein